MIGLIHVTLSVSKFSIQDIMHRIYILIIIKITICDTLRDICDWDPDEPKIDPKKDPKINQNKTRKVYKIFL